LCDIPKIPKFESNSQQGLFIASITVNCAISQRYQSLKQAVALAKAFGEAKAIHNNDNGIKVASIVVRYPKDTKV